MQIGAYSRPFLLSCALVLSLEAISGCGLLHPERLVYDQQGMRIGLEPDPTVARSGNQIVNDHPAALTSEEIQSLLHVIYVSGWSGTLLGMVETPRPVPLFTERQLSTISTALVAAFRDAKPTERVFFSLPKPDVAYSEDRTAGALFLRGRYLHVVVTDHSAFLNADTAGGDLRDARDTKGMKLWVSNQAQAAMVPDLEEPRWAPFETVHISLNVKDTLARQAKPLPSRINRETRAPLFPPPASFLSKTDQAGVSTEDLQLQIRELTSSNLELRSRLEEQTKRMEQLNEQMEQLRLELDAAKSKKQPSRKVPVQ